VIDPTPLLQVLEEGRPCQARPWPLEGPPEPRALPLRPLALQAAQMRSPTPERV